MKKSFAFTLAEIMVVLGVIGVLTAILLPAAFQATPDENVMKFKKAHNTFGTVIRELVMNEKYYKDGDLGVKPDGTELKEDEHYTYFCATFGDVVSTKKLDCSDSSSVTKQGCVILRTGTDCNSTTITTNNTVTDAIMQEAKEKLDTICADSNVVTNVGEEIVTTDGTIFYQVRPATPFGYYNGTTPPNDVRLFASPTGAPTHVDQNGMDIAYKIICMDVDGLDEGEAPFGYGVRADGKILTGARADEWMDKGIQGE